MGEKDKGLVMSVHRFSLQDGPGIRTTVFLKGCTLKCLWCHNPESVSRKRELAYFEDKCVHCGACSRVCPNGAHLYENGKHVFLRENCKVCGACADVCISEALRLTGDYLGAKEVLAEILKDKHYYDQSGGGITVSGGEPLAQPDFLIEILGMARNSGIHTCVETSGHAPRKIIDRVLPMVDYFLYDIKASDAKTHKKLTGADNLLILDNLDYLYNKGANIEIRCPLVPGINDSKEDLDFINTLYEKYPMVKQFTAMPFHNTGFSKYNRYGYTNEMIGMKNATAADIEGWKRHLPFLVVYQ